MNTHLQYSLVLAAAVTFARPAPGADLLDIFKSKPATNQVLPGAAALGGLTQDQMVGGLKEALGKGIQQAIGTLEPGHYFLKTSKLRMLLYRPILQARHPLYTTRPDERLG